MVEPSAFPTRNLSSTHIGLCRLEVTFAPAHYLQAELTGRERTARSLLQEVEDEEVADLWAWLVPYRHITGRCRSSRRRERRPTRAAG